MCKEYKEYLAASKAYQEWKAGYTARQREREKGREERRERGKRRLEERQARHSPQAFRQVRVCLCCLCLCLFCCVCAWRKCVCVRVCATKPKTKPNKHSLAVCPFDSAPSIFRDKRSTCQSNPHHCLRFFHHGYATGSSSTRLC